VKRALTNIGGAIVVEGDRALGEVLAHALAVDPGAQEGAEDEHRAHVHGFHSYAARMHPVTAARLVEALAPPRGVVLDPFCGSGTVLVEAMLAGRDAIGTDLNPLAVRLARCKTRVRDDAELEGLLLAAHEVASFADARRKARAGATRRFPEDDVRLFEPHVLLELGSLQAAIAKTAPPARDDLELVLSAILVKVSRKRGDTSDKTEGRRIAAGYTAKLFTKKTEELAGRLRALRSALPPGERAPRASVAVDDATELGTVTKANHPRRPSCIITSPPYVATYDYAAHHALRLRWLGLGARAFEQGELGARRRYTAMDGDAARRAWEAELGAFFQAAARVLRSGAPMVLLMADSAVGTTALRADASVAHVARAHGFAPIARASQARPHFHGPSSAAFRVAPRAEHALLVRRIAPTGETPRAPR
jgi:hypothetical protein